MNKSESSKSTLENGSVKERDVDDFPIIVIGASAGGFEALKKLTGALPKNLRAAIFIVWHMSPDIRGVLPEVLNRTEKIHAAHA